MTNVEEPEYPMFDKDTEALEIGFKDNMVISLKRLFTFRTLISIIVSIVSLIVIIYVIDYLTKMLAESDIQLSMPLLCLLMISIPAWTISFSNGVSTESKRKLNASGTAGILGRYIGSVIAGLVIMTIIYAAVMGVWYYKEGNMDLNLMGSYMIMISFVALVCALVMFCNTIFKRAGLVSYAIIFLLIPLIAVILGPYLGLMSLDEINSALPLVDSISSSATNGFGGGTLLTVTFLVKSSTPITADVMGSIILSIGWAILFIGLTIFMQYRREAKHDAQ